MDAIEQMRVDFRLLAADFLADGWSEAEVAEFGDAIKGAVNSGDVARLTDAAALLASLAEPIRRRMELAHGINGRVRAQIEELRKIEFFKSRVAA